MSITVLRPVLTAAVAGASLLWGGMSLTNYVESSPALLYAAGEARMAFGDAQAGLRLISRAEAIRSAKSQATQCKAPAAEDKTEAQPTKVEICTRTKKPAPAAKTTIPLPGGEAMLVLPEAPAPPEVRLVAASSFAPEVMANIPPKMLHAHGVHAERVRIEVFRKLQKASADAERMRGATFAAAMRSQTVDTAAIMRSVREELKKHGVPEGAVMMLQPPMATNE